MRYHPQFDMSCHGSYDAHDNHNHDTYHGHDLWPECKVALVVCGDKHIGCNFLTRLITPVLKKKKNHHSSLDWVFGNEFGQGWCDRETMLVVVENTRSGNTIPLPWKENKCKYLTIIPFAYFPRGAWNRISVSSPAESCVKLPQMGTRVQYNLDPSHSSS